MRLRDFLARVPEAVRLKLPPDLQNFQVKGPTASLVKLFYGDSPAIHYEVWMQRRSGRAEIGLHCEADRETNSRLLEHIVGRYDDVLGVLGSAAEPEQWTDSWTRVHEGLSLRALDEAFLSQVTDRLALYMAVLEPMVRKAL